MKPKSATPKHLGKSSQIPTTYRPEVLEAVEFHGASNSSQWVSLICPEFTSLCPVTGQPDFARVFVNYLPKKHLVESKSMKLYLFGFRNHGEFHEHCIDTICADLFGLLKPRYIEVIGEFTPRGGIAIFPFSQRSDNTRPMNTLRDARLHAYRPGGFSVSTAQLYGAS